MTSSPLQNINNLLHVFTENAEKFKDGLGEVHIRLSA